MDFFALQSVEAALELFLQSCPPGPLATETVDLAAGLGRVAAVDLRAGGPLPAFPRSTVDGLAVRASDVFGASEGLPAYLNVVEDIPMGRSPERQLQPGQCARIATGGMLPEGADAVVMVEYTEGLSTGEIGVTRPVAPGENVMQVGEDAAGGSVLVPAGRRLRGQELGLLAHAGIMAVPVARRPVCAILSTGDELVDPRTEPGPGQIRECNSYTIAGLVAGAGGLPDYLGQAGDDEEVLRAALHRAMAADVVLVSGGSSVGTRDLTARLIGRLGKPGILVHGVALKPGKPTILAVAGQKPVVGLPGHPVSAQVVFWLFVRPLLRHLQGLPPHPSGPGGVQARISKNVASAPGRTDVVRVAVVQRNGEWWADPVPGKSGLISTLVKADGLAIVPSAQEGLLAGDWVTVDLM